VLGPGRSCQVWQAQSTPNARHLGSHWSQQRWLCPASCDRQRGASGGVSTICARDTPSTAVRRHAPPLSVAASVVALEALIYGVFAVTEFSVTDPDNPAVGITTGIFFVVFAGFLGFCGLALYRLRSWARAPVVMTQIIQIPVAISFWGGGWTTTVSIVALVLSGIVLAGVFHPDSLEALENHD